MALKMKAAGIFAAVVLMAGMLPTAALAAEVSDTADSEDTTTVTATGTEEDTEDSTESETVSSSTASDADEADETDVETEVLAAILEILNSASEDSETTGTVTASALNVRCGAGMDYSVIDVIYRGDTVQVLGSDGSWYEITYDDVEGYVYSDYLTVTESSSGVSINLDSDSISTLISLLYSSGDEESEALTPDGNLTLVDDYGSSTEAGKQYITLVTKSGNYFYLIIDRDDEGEETVHFLNLVDESDLLALMDEDEAAEYESANADEEDAAETVDEDTDDTSAEDTEDTENEEETEEKSSGGSNTLILLVLFIIGVGAVGLFFYKKIGGGKGPAKTNGPDPDEDDDEPGYNLPVEEDGPDEPDEE